MSSNKFRFLAKAALAEGREDEEKPLLLEAAAKFGIPAARAGEIVDEIAEGQGEVARLPAEPTERAELFRSLLETAAASGSLTDREQNLFRKLAPRFGVDEYVVSTLLVAVEEQANGKAKSGVDPLIRMAMDAVPWDAFVLAVTPEGARSLSAATHGMPPPKTVATMLEALRLEPGSRVLHVGTGTGYTSAVLGRLAEEVYAVERQAPLAEFARRRFESLGYRNIHVRHGDGFQGWPEKLPFDAILISPSVSRDPRQLLEQLTIPGTLVMPVGSRRDRQTVVRFVRKSETEFVREELKEVRLVSLIGDILVELGAVTRAEVEQAAVQACSSGNLLGEELGNRVRVDESDIYRALAIQHGLHFGTVDSLLPEFDPSVVAAVPRAFLEHNHVIPICRVQGKQKIRVATCNPKLSTGMLATAFAECRRVQVYLVTPTDYRRMWKIIDLRLGQPREVEPELEVVKPDDDLLAETGPTRLDAHLIALFDAMLLDAVAERASDIHVERYRSGVRVRLRVDGELRDLDRYKLTPAELAGLVNVVKIRADLDIAERRLPQGGRIQLRSGGESYDLRVQTQPSLHGEHVVIRLLPQTVNLISIEGLGFPSELAGHYRRLIDNPAGLVLVVGPTGSGKSTTLYAGLQELARQSTRKVITVEDPIEYSIDNIQQTQVNPVIGFNFADAMRAFVREDPDVILVGEIRDGETALEAIRASQTGHLVLSTLHSNDAVDAVQRLYDLGMHPNSIASELLAVIAQRLAKRVCEGCKQRSRPNPTILAELWPQGPPVDFTCYEGRGCRRCRKHGTRGRIAVVEYLRTNPSVRGAIARQLPLDDLRQVAIESGLVTLRDVGIHHVNAGLIPLSELPRILPSERMAEEEGTGAVGD